MPKIAPERERADELPQFWMHNQKKFILTFEDAALETKFQIFARQQNPKTCVVVATIAGILDSLILVRTPLSTSSTEIQCLFALTLLNIIFLFAVALLYTAVIAQSCGKIKLKDQWIRIHTVAYFFCVIFAPFTFILSELQQGPADICVTTLMVAANAMLIGCSLVHVSFLWLPCITIYDSIVFASLYLTNVISVINDDSSSVLFLITMLLIWLPFHIWGVEKEKRRIISIATLVEKYGREMQEIFGDQYKVIKGAVPTASTKPFSIRTRLSRHEITRGDSEDQNGGIAQQNILLDQLRQAKKINDDLRMAKSESERFLSTMSHELRSPLHAMIATVSSLKDESLSESATMLVTILSSACEQLLHTVNDILDFQKAESGNLTLAKDEFVLSEAMDSVMMLFQHRLWDKALNLSTRVSGERAKLVGDQMRLKQILTNLVNNAIKFTETGEISVAASVSETEEGESLVEIQVKDTGCGFDEEEGKLLFKPFSQIDSALTRKHDGTGLGLVICDRLAKMMQGRIFAKSNKGHGSEFCFVLTMGTGAEIEPTRPLAEAVVAVRVSESRWLRESLETELGNLGATFADQAMQVSSGRIVTIVDSFDEAARQAAARPHGTDILLVQNHKIEVDSDKIPGKGNSRISVLLPPVTGSTLSARIRQLQLHSPESPGSLNSKNPGQHSLTVAVAKSRREQKKSDGNPRPVTKLKVLMAEDNLVNQKVGSMMLAKLNCHVTIANNGQEAVDIFRAQTDFDLVLMDLHMPVLGGLESARQITEIKNEQKLRLPPIIALTADVTPKILETCVESGMVDLMNKPFSKEQLENLLHTWTSKLENRT